MSILFRAHTFKQFTAVFFLYTFFTSFSTRWYCEDAPRIKITSREKKFSFGWVFVSEWRGDSGPFCCLLYKYNLNELWTPRCAKSWEKGGFFYFFSRFFLFQKFSFSAFLFKFFFAVFVVVTNGQKKLRCRENLRGEIRVVTDSLVINGDF